MIVAVSVLCSLLFTVCSVFLCDWELISQGEHPARCSLDSLRQGLFQHRKYILTVTVLCLVGGSGLLALDLCRHQMELMQGLRLLYCFDLLAVAACIDLLHRIIPNKLVLFGFLGGIAFGIGAVYNGVTPALVFRESLLGLAMGGGVFLVCALITKGGIGMGDVKLFAVLGILLGWTGVFDLIFLSVLLVAVYGIFLIFRKKLTRSSEVPIAPFALLGITLMMLLGI